MKQNHDYMHKVVVLQKAVTDTNKNSSYAGAEAIGGVTGGWGCKGSAYGNSRYEQKGYKTVTHQKKYNIFDFFKI